MKKKTLLLVAGITWVIIIALAFFALNGINPDNVTTTNTTIISGNKTVDITAYSDFQCQYCARAEMTLKKIKETYGGRVAITFKHFPLPFHNYAKKAAEASECARDQGKFQEYHDILFENQNKLDVASLKSYASRLGLDREKFDSCLDGGEKADIVKKDHDEGISKGVSGTPTFFINEKKLVGSQPFENFKSVIDSELK